MTLTKATSAAATALVAAAMLHLPVAQAAGTSESASGPAAVPSATWADCESYARRARTGCLTGQYVQPWAKCPASLVGWFTLTKATSALVRCKKSGAGTKWVWA